MTQYLVLLRGINISGKNKVSMPLLKETLIKNGFENVLTYINSGNVLLSDSEICTHKLIEKIRIIILKTFELDIPVTVVPVHQLIDTIEKAPLWWGDSDKDVIHYAIFLIPPISIEEVFDAVGEIKPEYERIDYHGNVIFWSAPRLTFNKAQWSKIASSNANNHVTIRTANTIKKMIQLSAQ